MSEKIELTQEQARAIEFALTTKRMAYYKDPDCLLTNHIRTREFVGNLEPLSEISSATLAKALYIGYTVKPKFKVGDWIFVEARASLKGSGEVTKVVDVYYGGETLVLENDISINARSKYIRHATPEEIAEEKTRRWWKKHDRNVWDVKEHDTLTSTYMRNCVVSKVEDDCITFTNGARATCDVLISDGWKVKYFAEDRKDLKS